MTQWEDAITTLALSAYLLVKGQRSPLSPFPWVDEMVSKMPSVFEMSEAFGGSIPSFFLACSWTTCGGQLTVDTAACLECQWG